MKTNTAEWNKKFSSQAKIVVKVDSEILNEAVETLYKRIIERTPVGNPALWHPPVYPKGYTPGSLRAAWKLEKLGDTYYITNDLPYAYRVETGYSTQAPAGMMRVSVIEFNKILEEVAGRHKV